MSATGFLVRTGLTIGDIGVGFYGFWLVWRLLLPVLPGPDERRERIAPFACYFTDPFVVPIARLTRLPERAITLASLVVAAAVLVALDEIATWV
jgi:hypothetical protein